MWYAFSAWWFNEIYIWSADLEADIWWIMKEDRVKLFGKKRLNEKTVYLLSFYVTLAVLQGALHLYNDYDQIRLPSATSKTATKTPTEGPKTPTARIRDGLPVAILRSLGISFVMAFVNPFIYARVTRYWFWYPSVNFVGLAYNLSPDSRYGPPATSPFHISHLVRTAGSGALLLLLWEVSNLSFSAYLVQEPVKKGLPLSSESKDPNGTLLQGLNAKKEIPKSFAFWELNEISERFADRRKIIFNDIDREGGPAWTQILQVSLAVMQNVQKRIQEFENPTPMPTADASQPPLVIQTLPTLTEGPKSDNIFLNSPAPASRPERLEARLGPIAKSYGQSAPWTPSAKAKAAAVTQSLIEWAPDHIFSPKRPSRKALPPATSAKSSSLATSSNESMFTKFIKSPLSSPIRQTIPRRISNVVLGEPYSNLLSITHAANSLTRLAIASLEEDNLGKVSLDILLIVKTFTETIAILETFVAKMQGTKDGNGESKIARHWTDVPGSKSLSDFFPTWARALLTIVLGGQADQVAKASALSGLSTSDKNLVESSKMAEVNTLRITLKGSLADLLDAFKLYLEDIGLKGRDLRLAREAAGLGAEGSADGVGGSTATTTGAAKKPEMKQV